MPTYWVISADEKLPHNEPCLALLRPVFDNLVDAVVSVSLLWGKLGHFAALVVAHLVVW